jgi:transposase-like protein
MERHADGGKESKRPANYASQFRIVEESLNAGISVVEFTRQRDLHPSLVHTWRWQEMLSETSNGEARFAPVAIVPATDACGLVPLAG